MSLLRARARARNLRGNVIFNALPTVEPYAWFSFLTLALLARLATLRYESFWHDEIFTRDVISGSFAEMNRKIVEVYDHPPIYFWLLRLWTRPFGVSEFSMRL